MLNIQEIVAKYGIDNVVVKLKMLPLRDGMLFNYTSSRDKAEPVHCKIVEDRYQVSEGYKIGIHAISAGFGGETFYQSDFSEFVWHGSILVYAYVKGILIDVSDEMESPCNP